MTRVRLHAEVAPGATLIIDREADHVQFAIGKWSVELFEGKLTVRPLGDAINAGTDVLRVDAE